MILRPRITKEKLEALIKAVEEGGDDRLRPSTRCGIVPARRK
jgi:hypothetical protein